LKKLGYQLKAFAAIVGFFLNFHRAGEFQRKKKLTHTLAHFAVRIMETLNLTSLLANQNAFLRPLDPS